MDFLDLISSSPVADFWLGRSGGQDGDSSGGPGEPLDNQNFQNQLSDVVRLLVLERHGGAYLDADTASRAAVPTDLDNFIMKGDRQAVPTVTRRLSNLVRPPPDRTFKINGAVMQFQKSHPFLRFAIDEMVRGQDAPARRAPAPYVSSKSAGKGKDKLQGT